MFYQQKCPEKHKYLDGGLSLLNIVLFFIEIFDIIQVFVTEGRYLNVFKSGVTYQVARTLEGG